MIRLCCVWVLLVLAVNGREAVGESLSLESRVAQQRGLSWLCAQQAERGDWLGGDLRLTARAAWLLSHISGEEAARATGRARAFLLCKLPELPPDPVLLEVLRALVLTGGLPVPVTPPVLLETVVASLNPAVQMGWLELCYLGVIPASGDTARRVETLQQALLHQHDLPLRLFAGLTLPELPWSEAETAELAETVQRQLTEADWSGLYWSARALTLYEHRQPAHHPVIWRNHLLALLLERQNSQGGWGDSLTDALYAMLALHSAR